MSLLVSQATPVTSPPHFTLTSPLPTTWLAAPFSPSPPTDSKGQPLQLKLKYAQKSALYILWCTIKIICLSGSYYIVLQAIKQCTKNSWQSHSKYTQHTHSRYIATSQHVCISVYLSFSYLGVGYTSTAHEDRYTVAVYEVCCRLTNFCQQTVAIQSVQRLLDLCLRISVYNLCTWKSLMKLKNLRFSYVHTTYVDEYFSPTNPYTASLSPPYHQVSTLSVVLYSDAHRGFIYSLSWSHDSHMISTASADGLVK